MLATNAQPKPIRLETERFLLRTLRQDDATQVFVDWFADAEVMIPTNRRPAKITRESLAKYIASRDGINELYIGIFERRSGRHVGNYMVLRDRAERTATIHVIIGDRAFWGDKVILETRPALLDYFFRSRGVEKAIGTPPARNFPAVFNYKAEGWRLEGVLKGHLKSKSGKGRLDQFQFGLLKDEWLAMRNEQQS